VSAEPLALGLVGCGRLAAAGYLPALAAVGAEAGVRLVAVADPDAARREEVATLGDATAPVDDAGVGGGASHSGPVAAFPDAATLLDRADVDGVILATPAAAHLADAERAAAAGVPVLVEKPPAPDATAAAALAALVPPPWVGFNRRFDPGARAVRRAVPAEGPVRLRLEIGYRRRSWGAHAVRDDALLDLGPHLVDWARWLSSCDVVEVACTELRADRVAADLVLSGGGRAAIRAATDRPHTELVELRSGASGAGGAGDLLARHRLGGLVAAVRGRLPARHRPDALVASLAGQVAAFAAAIRGEPPAELGTAADGHAVMTVIDAVRASAADGGRPTPVAQPVNP
jgi:myo-inositol 2-dehydrogenase/D-chiro-inositol 1-dehydrogenase